MCVILCLHSISNIQGLNRQENTLFPTYLFLQQGSHSFLSDLLLEESEIWAIPSYAQDFQQCVQGLFLAMFSWVQGDEEGDMTICGTGEQTRVICHYNQLCTGITPDRAQCTIWVSGAEPSCVCMKKVSCPLFFLS